MYVNINGLKDAVLSIVKAKRYIDNAISYCVFNDIPNSSTYKNELMGIKNKIIELSNDVEVAKNLLDRKIVEFENAENRNITLANQLANIVTN